jgi:hypothetical protein
MRRALLLLGAWSALVAAPATAQVQTHRESGLALDRFRPASPGSEWLVCDALQYQGDTRVVTALLLDWAHKPLVLYGPGSSELALIANQVYAHLGASLMLSDRFRLSISVPLVLVQNGTSFIVDDREYVAPSRLDAGDIRLGADAIVWAPGGRAPRVGGGAAFFIPSGSRESFSGDRAFRADGNVALAGEVGALAYAGRFAAEYHRNSDFAGAPFGSALQLALAVGYHTPVRPLFVGVETYGSTVVSRDHGYFGRLTSPLEAIAMARLRLPRGWAIHAGAGPGLSRGLGTPRFRVVAGVEWTPRLGDVAGQPASTPASGSAAH